MTVRQLITEIKIALTVNSVIRIILKTIILFLMMILLYNTLNIPKILVAIPLIYLVGTLYIELKKNKINQLEEKNPKLREKLRTVIDTFDAENEIAKELKKGVLKDLKNVKVSQFIDHKKILKDFFFIATLAVIITIMLPYKIDYKSFDFSNQPEDSLYKRFFSFADRTNQKEEESSENKGDSAGRGKFTTIFGNRTTLKTGEDEVGIELESKTSIAKSENTDLKNMDEEDKKSAKSYDSPLTEVYVQESEEEKKKIIEEFYEKLSR